MLDRADRLWLAVEKAAVVAGFLVMSAVVFADVLHRQFADEAWQTPSRLIAVGLCAWALCVAGVRTATREKNRRKLGLTDSDPEGTADAPALPWGKSILAGFGIAAAFAALTYGFVWLRPSGLIWAQKLALVLTIWVAMLGASIATREGRHLKIDAAEKLFKGPARRIIGVVGNLIAAVACGALAVLAVMQLRAHYALYSETEGAAGEFEGLPLPMWLGFTILPLSFAIMALRFVAAAVDAARGRFRHDPLGPAGGDAEGVHAAEAVDGGGGK